MTTTNEILTEEEKELEDPDTDETDGFLETTISYGLILKLNLRDLDTVKGALKQLRDNGVKFCVVYQKASTERLWICNEKN